MTLPPGRLRLATRPSSTGSSPIVNTIGMVVVAALAAMAPRRCRSHDHRHLAADQIGRQRRQPIELALGPAIFDRDVAALDVAGFAQALAERGQVRRSRTLSAIAAEKPDHRHRRLLRARRERPRGRRAAEQRDELRRVHCPVLPCFRQG